MSEPTSHESDDWKASASIHAATSRSYLYLGTIAQYNNSDVQVKIR